LSDSESVGTKIGEFSGIVIGRNRPFADIAVGAKFNLAAADFWRFAEAGFAPSGRDFEAEPRAAHRCGQHARHEEQSMSGWLLTVEPYVFLGISIALFGLLTVLSYQKKTGSAFIVLLGAMFSAALLYIDHISEIAATATSLTIKVREASDALTGLKKLAALTGEGIISLDSKVGAFGGDPAAERDRRKQQVLDVLRSLNLDQQSLDQVANSDRERDLSDITAAIMNRVYNCVLPQAPQTQAEQAEWSAEWVKMQTTLNSWPPSPSVLKALIERYKIADSFSLRLLDEYEKFFQTGEHKDIQFWRDREMWPMFPASGAGSVGKCAS
jgi:hypothetical protein